MNMHPVQFNYQRTGNEQTRGLCGAREVWSTVGKAQAEKSLSEVAQWNTLHLVHLVKEHLTDVQASLSTAGRAQEVALTEPDVRKKVTAAA
jgi:hypothetical protein